METSVAKRMIADALASRGLKNKLTAKTVGFSDLARGAAVFVTVKDWKPDPFAAELETLAMANGFRVSFAGSGFVS